MFFLAFHHSIVRFVFHEVQFDVCVRLPLFAMRKLFSFEWKSERTNERRTDLNWVGERKNTNRDWRRHNIWNNSRDENVLADFYVLIFLPMGYSLKSAVSVQKKQNIKTSKTNSESLNKIIHLWRRRTRRKECWRMDEQWKPVPVRLNWQFYVIGCSH